MYLLMVGVPVICAMRPGVGEISWSMDIISPGVCAAFIRLWPVLPVRCHHFRLVALEYIHDAHVGGSHFARYWGKYPIFAMCCSLVIGM